MIWGRRSSASGHECPHLLGTEGREGSFELDAGPCLLQRTHRPSDVIIGELLSRRPVSLPMATQLARQGESATLELVRRIMREPGLVPCQPRPWRAP
jgi:hypothetical protein